MTRSSGPKQSRRDLLNAKADKGTLYVFADPAQNLFQEQQAKLPDIPAKYKLSANCRNTRSIAQAIRRVHNVEIKLKEDAPEGEPPVIETIEDPGARVHRCDKQIRSWLNEGKLAASQIAVLSPKKKEHGCLAQTKTLAGLPIVEDIGPWRSDKGIFFAPIRGFKGLEADAVVMIDVDDSYPLHERRQVRRLFAGAA